MKKKEVFLTAFIGVCALMLLAPNSVFAKTSTKVWFFGSKYGDCELVDGKSLCGIEKAENDYSDEIFLDEESNTLVLNNFVAIDLDVRSEKPLNIVLKGTNKVLEPKFPNNVSDSENGLSWEFGGETINVSGDGKLIATYGGIKFYGKSSEEPTNLTIKDVDIDIKTSTNYGMYVVGNLNVDNAKISIDGVKTGLKVFGSLNFNGGSLNIKNFKEYGLATDVHSELTDTKVTINSGNINIDGNNDSYAGISLTSKNFILNGGSVKIKNSSIGLYVGEYLTCKAKLNGGNLIIENASNAALMVPITINANIKEWFSFDEKKILLGDPKQKFYMYPKEGIINTSDDYTVATDDLVGDNYSDNVSKSVSFLSVYDKSVEKEKTKEVINKDDDLILKYNIPISEFRRLYVNNQLLSLDNGDYTLEEGSTIITISNKYLNSLDSNNFEIKAVFDNGVVVENVKFASSNVSNPETSDNILLLVMLGIVSLGGFSIILRRRYN